MERSVVSSPCLLKLTDHRQTHDVEYTLETVTKYVGKAKSKAPLRVFTLGIGETTSTAMCEGIARAGNGVCLMAATSESIIAKCSKLVRASRTYILKNISVDWRVGRKTQAIRQAPQEISALYSGNRFVVFALIRPPSNQSKNAFEKLEVPGEIVLRAQRDGRGSELKFHFPVEERPYRADGPHLIHVLAARRIIQELTDGESKDTFGTAKPTIVQLGKQYQLASAYTSFVAVDEEGHESAIIDRPPSPPYVHAWLDSIPQSRPGGSSVRHHRGMSVPVSAPATVPSYSATSYYSASPYTAPSYTAFAQPPVTGSFSARGPPRPPSIEHSMPIVVNTEHSLALPRSSQPISAEYMRSPGMQARGRYSDSDSDVWETYTPPTMSHEEPVEEYDSRSRRSPHRSKPPSYPITIVHTEAPHQPPTVHHVRSSRRATLSVPVAQPIVIQPSSSRRRESATVQADADRDVVDLVRLQSFNGSFLPSPQLERFVGSTALGQGKTLGIDMTVWATALAVAYLKKHLADQPELLEGLLEKATEFISMSPGVNFQSILEIARPFIK